MFRTLLGTILLASQILNGFWANASLCLRSDGTVCCVHDSAQSCPCCEHDHDEAASGADEHAGHGHVVCAIADNHVHEEENQSSTKVPIPTGTPLTQTTPCGCHHQPLTSASIPAAQKASRVTDSNRKLCRPAIPLDFRCSRTVPSLLDSTFRPIQSPACLSVGLTLVASTVIRC